MLWAALAVIPWRVCEILVQRRLHLLKVCIWRRVSENPKHRDNLTFVVKCMGDDMQ